MMFIFLLERTNKCLVNIKGAPPFLYNTILMFYFIVALGEREFSWPVISLSLEWLGLLKWQTRVQCDEIKSLIFNKLGLRTKGFFHASLTRFNEIIAHFEISSNLWFTLSHFTFKIRLLFCITGTLVSHKLPTDSDPSPSPGCRRGATTIKGYWGGQTAPSAAARMMMNGGDHAADRPDHLPVAGKADEKQMMSVSPLRTELSGWFSGNWAMYRSAERRHQASG